MPLEPTQTLLEHVLLRSAMDGSGLAHLTWRAADQGDRIVQVYVDGRLYDVARDPTRRAMWVQVDPTHAHAVELLAVDESERWQDHRERLGGWSSPLVFDVTGCFARDESLAIDARATVKVDGKPVTDDPLWSSSDPRGGLGGLHGQGQFGFDQATAPGNGLGDFGFGPFGSGGQAWCWIGLVPPGMHQIEFDVGGNLTTIESTIDDLGQTIMPAISQGPTVTLNW